MDCEILKNFRPVSNLAFISKILEKVVASRIKSYVAKHCLHDPFQSAYKQFHSTETVLVKLNSDILNAIDSRHSVLLVLLDLSAAFDTVDHELLIQILSTRFGIKGSALAWIKSYLSDRKQYVCIKGHYSDKHDLSCGVPQGSVLGPILFTMYVQSLAATLDDHDIDRHAYADDKQLYALFQQSVLQAMLDSVHTMESCIIDVRAWMTSHFLKLNDDKTEYMLIQSRYIQQLKAPNLKVGDTEIEPVSSVKNLGVIFDENMTMEKHVVKQAQVAFFHLRNIGKICRLLTEESTKTIVHSFVTSKLDYCNALLIDLPKKVTDKLQNVQDAAARIVMMKRKRDHLTPMYQHLHWLTVRERIIFKVLLLTFKSIHGKGPEYMNTLIKPHNPSRNLRSGNLNLLHIPKTNMKTYGDRSFCLAATQLWNALPNDMRSCLSLDMFKSKAKTCLFKLSKYGSE